jgi:hypothetical protein
MLDRSSSDRGHLGLQPGNHVSLSHEADAICLVPEDPRKTRSARAVIGCVVCKEPPLTLEQMDPALYADAAGASGIGSAS